MFCLLIWRCLQVKISLSRADGQKKRSKRKSRSLFILPFTKKSTIITGTWVRHLNTIFWPGWGGGGEGVSEI